MSFLDRFRGPTLADGLPFAETRDAALVPLRRRAPGGDQLVGDGPGEQFAAVAQALAGYQIGKPSWPERDPLIYDQKGYRQVSLIYHCVRLISHAVGTAPLRIYDEAQDDEEIPDHELRRLVRQPNPLMGEALFWGTIATRAAVAGFCVVEKERDQLGRIIALNPLRSPWCRAVPLGRSRYAWDYHVPGISTPFRLEPENVVVFRWSDTPDGSPYGIGPVAICIRDAALLTKMIDFLGVLFEHGAVPLHGLILDTMPGQTLDQTEVDLITARFLQRHGGLDKAAIPVLLQNIKDIKRLGFDLDELAYTDLRDVSELEITRAFGVPPRKAITRVGLQHTTQNATAAVEDGEFYRDTIVPIWTRFDDAATTSLLPEFETIPTTRYLGFDTSDVAALQENRNDRAPWMIQGFGAGGFSHHTIHRELGLPVPETPDFYLRSIAVEAIPVEDPLGTQQPEPKAPPPAQDPPKLGTVRVREITAGRQPSERLAAIGAGNRKMILKVAKRSKPAISRYFAELGERVVKQASLAAIVSPDRQLFATLDIDWDDEEERLKKPVTQLHLLAGETSFDQVAAQLKVEIDWDLANPKVRDVMRVLAARVKDINRASKERIQEVVTKAAEDGVSIEELRDRLQAEFKEWTASRAETVARTESQVSYNSASLVAYQETGVVDEAILFDNPDHDADPGSDGLTCAQRNGLVVPLAEVGKHIDAEHPNGTLAVGPIVKDDE